MKMPGSLLRQTCHRAKLFQSPSDDIRRRQPAGLVARFDLNGGMRDPEAPIQQSTKVEMFLNLKTAKALGITVVPLPLSGRADQVLE
jgi:hypothetical protein